jgi:3-dehydroquinate synthase
LTLPALAGEIGRVEVGPGSSYPVVVGEGLLDRIGAVCDALLPGRSLALISDSNVMPLHGGSVANRLRAAGRRVTLHAFEAGEESKTRRTWSILTDEMLDAGHGRDSAVVAVGGGVTTDLGGFVAATYLRGVPVVQLPTSMLAMIDASTGGKTGVDVRAGKNLVGAFHRPAAVIADVRTLATLPRHERAQGLVEAVKHGAILDRAHFQEIEARKDELLNADPVSTAAAVLASVKIKAGVVSADEHEAGYRQILNFGHTLGHAIEAAAGYGVGHGSAVALGMKAEARVGEALEVTLPGTEARVAEVLDGLLGSVAAPIDAEAVVSFLGADKKTRAGRPRYVLLSELGKVDPGTDWTHEVPDELVREALHAVLGGG